MLTNINVIIPFNATEREKFAAEELIFFLKEIADVNAQILFDRDFDANGAYVSLGKTLQYINAIGEQNLLNQVGQDGFYLKATCSCAFICGGAGQGTIFGVYRFLKEQFNLVIYTDKVYTFDKKPLEFLPYEIFDKPHFDYRALGIYPVHLEKREPDMGDKRYCYRMRLRQMDEGWGINNHCYFSVLPPEIYKENHPDWYSAGGKQLCLTNDGVISEYVKNMKKIIEDTPEDTLYMFGMQDTLEQCHCENCKKVIDEFGYSTLTLLFCNEIAKQLNQWLKSTYPERKIYFYTFAYVWAITPPVKKLENGSFVPLLNGVQLEDNLGVLIAPLYSSTNYAWNDIRAKEALTTNYYEKQVPLVDIFEGWRAVVNHIAVWSYNHNFADYMVPVPMWNGLQENFRYFKQLNATYVFMEAGCTERSNFAEMKTFVCSNLMWDTNLNVDDLIRQFMAVYFKGAEKYVYEYFVSIHAHSVWLKNTFNREMIFVQFDDEPNGRLMQQRFWPKDTLVSWVKIFESAKNSAASPEVQKRINLEALPVKFTLLYFYLDELDKDFAHALIEDVVAAANAENLGVVAIDEETKTYEEFAEIWKNKLAL